MVKEKELSGEGTFFAPALGPSHHVPAHPQPARVRHHWKEDQSQLKKGRAGPCSRKGNCFCQAGKEKLDFSSLTPAAPLLQAWILLLSRHFCTLFWLCIAS